MIYLIGFGLSSAQDLTLRAVSVLKKCEQIYLDSYTSIAIDPYALTDLKDLIGKDFIEADRKLVEQGTEILSAAKKIDIAFLVIGDPLSATTHIDIIQRAIIENIPYETINNTSIMTAVGITGLCLYEFGKTVSIPLWDEFGEPMSFYDRIESNMKIGAHTLCLLDIKVKEQSLENLLKGNNIYEPARFMTSEVAAKQIVTTIGRLEDKGLEPCLTISNLVVGLARIGSPEQSMAVATLETFFRMLQDGTSKLSLFMGRPLHSLIVLGPLQVNELEHFTMSVTKLRSKVQQPVFYMNPNKIATADDKNAIIRILHDHNLRCKEVMRRANEIPECPESTTTNGDSKEECNPNNPPYIPRLL